MTNAIDRIAPDAPTTQATAVEQARAVVSFLPIDRNTTSMSATIQASSLASGLVASIRSSGLNEALPPTTPKGSSA